MKKSTGQGPPLAEGLAGKSLAENHASHQCQRLPLAEDLGGKAGGKKPAHKARRLAGRITFK